MKDFKKETEKILLENIYHGHANYYEILEALYQLHLEGVREIIKIAEKYQKGYSGEELVEILKHELEKLKEAK